jgi:hypothetical protein
MHAASRTLWECVAKMPTPNQNPLSDMLNSHLGPDLEAFRTHGMVAIGMPWL